METGWLRIYFDSNAYTTVPATRATTAAAVCSALCKKKQMHPDATQTHALFVTDAANEHVFERRLSGSEHPLEVQEKIRKHGNLDHFKLHFRALDDDDTAAEQQQQQRTSDGGESAIAGGTAGGTEAGGAGSLGAGSLDDKQAGGESSDDEMFGSTAPPTPSSRSLVHGSSSGSLFSASSRSLLGSSVGGGASVAQPLSYAAQAMAADPSIVRCGYLDKRGKRNTAWKERWFVLRAARLGARGSSGVAQLSYYKSHVSGSPIATIPLVDAFVRPCHTACVGGAMLPFEAAPSVTNLTLSPALPVPHAHSSLSKCSLEFQIDTLTRLFFMRARSYPEMLNWVQAVGAHLAPCIENDLIDALQAQIDAQEFDECDLEEKRLAHIMTLQGLLKDAIGIEQFVQFETENHSEENVLFYLESEGYYQSCVAGNKTPAQLLERAKSIFVNFLEAGAPQEIHIPGEARNSIRAAIQSGDIHPTLFQACQQSVFTLLQASSFANFLQSKHFQRAMLKLSIIGSSYDGSAPPSTEPTVSSSSPDTPITLLSGAHQRQGSGMGMAPHGPTGSMLDEGNSSAHLAMNSGRTHASLSGGPSQRAPGQMRAGGGAKADSLGAVQKLDRVQAGGDIAHDAHLSEEPSNVDDSHSLSGAPAPAPAVSILSSLYGVAPALGSALSSAAFGPTTNTTSVHSSDSAAAAAAAAGTTPLSHGPVGPLTSSTNMSPSALAAYLESIGEMDAIRRSATVTTRQQHGSADPDPNAAPSEARHRSSRDTITGDGDGDSDSESEVEEAEEEGMFGTTPKPGSNSILDDSDRSSVSHSGTPHRSARHHRDAAKSPSSPSVEVVTEESDFFTTSRTRSTDSVSHVATTHTHTVFGSGAGGAGVTTTTTTTTSSTSTRHLSAISEDVRASPSHSLGGSETRSGGGVSGAAAAFLDEHDDALMSASAPRARGTTMSLGAPPSVVLPASPLAPTASPAASGGAGAGLTSSSTKWKKNRSIFDDDDDAPPQQASRGLKSSPMGSPPRAPAPAAQPSSSPAFASAAAPSPSAQTASTIDLDLLQQETVDIADLNLDLADADATPHVPADDGDMF